LSTLSEALTAYCICARAEGKSPRTIEWITSSVGYFVDFLGGDQDIDRVTGDDLRRFIIALQTSHKYRKHPYTKPQQEKLSPQTIETYARGVRAFFSYMHREGLIDANPMQKIKVPKVPKKVVPTFSEKDVERLLAQPDKHTDRGFRDYSLMLTLIDTAGRLSEIVNLKVDDVDQDNGYLKVMGKGGKERYVPFGRTVAKALLKYKLKHRAEPLATDRLFLTNDGRPLTAGRVEKIISEYGKKVGLKRCYAHKLRHTSSVMYLRNGGDPFSLQKKLGHSSLQMTRHYSNLADSDVRAQHLKFGVADKLRL
jgi:site-specific recombinase XerD